MKLRRYMAFFTAALALSGCGDGSETVSDIVDGGPGARSGAIEFGLCAAGTRAAGEETLATLQSEGFGVFAARTGRHPYASSSVSSDFMWNQEVSYEGSRWTYSPESYWPGNEEYVTFYAYAPYSCGAGHSGKASGCIIDFSRADEQGDPWLVYQVAATSDEQVDLLYDFVKDRQRGDDPAQITFSFKHALAGAGDMVTVGCRDDLKSKLVALAESLGADVTLTLNRLTLDYTLTRKGRLVLNSADEPNWQPVMSDDPTIHRKIVLEPGHAVATASAGTSECTVSEYSEDDIGVFYIPMNVGGNEQQVEITVLYTVSPSGYQGVVSMVVPLNTVNTQSVSQDFRLMLSGNVPLSGE